MGQWIPLVVRGNLLDWILITIVILSPKSWQTLTSQAGPPVFNRSFKQTRNKKQQRKEIYSMCHTGKSNRGLMSPPKSIIEILSWSLAFNKRARSAQGVSQPSTESPLSGPQSLLQSGLTSCMKSLPGRQVPPLADPRPVFPFPSVGLPVSWGPVLQ